MHVTAAHRIGLLLFLNVYAYITDKRAFRQTKLATLVLALARYDTGTYLRAPSQPVFRAHHCDRPIDHATPSVNNRPHLGNYTVVRPSNIGCRSAQRIIQNEPTKPASLQISLSTDITVFIYANYSITCFFDVSMQQSIVYRDIRKI